MRNPNGYGGVCRLPGNRRRPYRARITVGWEKCGEGRGKQKYLTLGYFATRGEALMALADYNREPFDPELRRTTFRGVYEMWSPGYFEKFPSTRRVTECAMAFCRRLWHLPIGEIRTNQLQEVILGMTGKSRGYQSKVRSLMHMLYRHAISHGIATRDWSEYVELTAEEQESPRRVFTGEEVGLLWRLSESGGPVPGESVFMRGLGLLDSALLLLYTGMRVGELLSLRREDVHLEERYIDLHGTKTKAARRHVPIHRRVLPLMERQLARHTSELYLPGPDGGGIGYPQYKSWFDRVMDALGLDHTPHDTRHTFISALDTAGVRRAAVKFIAGHSQRDVTDRYTHKDVRELIGEVDKVEY